MSVVVILCVLMAFYGGCGQKPRPRESKSPSPSPSLKAATYENKEIGYRITIPDGWKTPKGVHVGELYVEFGNATFEPKPSFNIVSTKVKKFDLAEPAKQKEIKDEIEKNLKTATERSQTIAGETAYQIIYGMEQGDTTLLIYQTYLFHKEHLIVLTGGCKEDKYPLFAADYDKFIKSLKLE